MTLPLLLAMIAMIALPLAQVAAQTVTTPEATKAALDECKSLKTTALSLQKSYLAELRQPGSSKAQSIFRDLESVVNKLEFKCAIAGSKRAMFDKKWSNILTAGRCAKKGYDEGKSWKLGDAYIAARADACFNHGHYRPRKTFEYQGKVYSTFTGRAIR